MMTILTRKRSFPGQQIHKYCSQLRQFYFIRPGPITRSLNIVSFRGELVHEGTTMNSYTVETNKYLQLFHYQQQNHEITRW